MSAPPLDARTFDELVAEVQAAARRRVPGWEPAEGDPGFALRAIFAHDLELVLARLNRAPDKSLVAFLDLLGISLMPPSPAAAPVTFTLAPDGPAAGPVPSGTQVATAQTETTQAVVFETAEDLVVTAAQIAAAFTIDPEHDRYADQTEAVAGTAGIVFHPFAGDRPIPHLLHLGLEPDRRTLAGATGRLIVEVDDAVAASDLARLEWAVWRGGTWEPLGLPKVLLNRVVFEGVRGPDAATALAEPALSPPPAARWLRARATEPVGAAAAVTKGVGVLAQMSTGGDMYTGDVTAGGTRLKAGDQLPAGTTFASFRLDIATVEASAIVHLVVDLTKGSSEGTRRVTWTGWDGSDWQDIGSVALTPGGIVTAQHGVADSTRALRQAGCVTFARPEWLKRAALDPTGRAGYWLRVELKD